MQPSTLAKRAWLFLFIGIAGFYLWGLGSLPLVGPDEPRYAEGAREMLARRDLITPTLGGLPWFEKPPLLYWMMMASYRFLGVTEYAARLGPALCGLVTAFFVYWIGTAIGRQQTSDDQDVEQDGSALGRWSALVWLSSLGAIVFSRGASFDIVLTMTITGVLACFFVLEAGTRSGSDGVSQVRTRSGSDGVSQVRTRSGSDGVSLNGRTARRNTLLLGFYFFAGLSLLAKGLVGFVLILGIIAGYYLIRRESPRRSFLKSLLWGVPLSLGLAAVWYTPIIARHGWTFIDQFIIQHHFARYVTNKYHHPGPFYFYVPVLVALALPWTVFLIVALLSSRRWQWRGESSLDRGRVFAFAWLVVPIVFFSFSGSKLTAYILPVMPAVALLTGESIVCFLRAGRGHKVLRLSGVALIGVATIGGWYSLRHLHLSFNCVAAASLPLLLVGAAVLVNGRRREYLFALIVIVMFITSAVALKCAAPVVARPESVRDLLAAAAMRGYGSVPVVQMHTVERTAEFYAASRMSYRADGEPVKLEGVAQVAEAAHRNGGVVLCFVPIEFESQLTSYKDAQTEVIADNGRVALLAVHVK